MKLANKHKFTTTSEQDIEMFFVANLKNNPKIWIGELLEDQYREEFLKYKAYIESLSYNVMQELEEILESTDSPAEAFISVDGQNPKTLELYYQGKVSEETLIVLDRIVGFISYWNKKLSDPIIWPNKSKFLKKYEKFVPEVSQVSAKKLTEMLLS